MSETASDAWSTDVLTSDTSERQAERLLELDQDEVASVSSRSQGPEDSEAGEPIPVEDVGQHPGEVSSYYNARNNSFSVIQVVQLYSHVFSAVWIALDCMLV